MDIISHKNREKCGRCGGNGKCHSCYDGVCPRCSGKGESNTTYTKTKHHIIVMLEYDYKVKNPDYCPLCKGNHQCSSCNGTQHCSACGGTGWI